MRRLWRTLALGACMLSGCGKERTTDELARVGATGITAREFTERYTAYRTATPMRDNILLRKKILENMVNEVILMEDIRRQGFDRDSAAALALERMRTQTLLVLAAKSVTVDTMHITEAELTEEFRAYTTKIAARFVYGASLAEARELKRRIDAGESFEALAKDHFDDPGLAGNGGYIGYFGYGEMDPALEKTANALPVGGISEPVKLSMGYAIIKVENKVTLPLASEADFEQVREKLARSIQERKVMSLMTDAAHAESGASAARFHDGVLAVLFGSWPALEASGSVEPAGKPALPADSALVDVAGRTWTVGEFLRKLRLTTPGQRRSVRTPEALKDLIRGLAARERLLDEARRKNLDRSSEYTQAVEAKTKEYLLKRWGASVQDTVGKNGLPEAELLEYFGRNRGLYAVPPERNVGEILVRTEAEASGLARAVAKGKNFYDLARKRSIRLWAARKGGELGYGTKSTFGILGEKFFAAPIGAIIGPEKVDPYFGVFKILAEKEGHPKSFAEARDDVVRDVLFLKKQEVFKRSVAALRAASSFQMFEDRLEAVVIQ